MNTVDLVEEGGIVYAVGGCGTRTQIRPRPIFATSWDLLSWGHRARFYLTPEEHQEAVGEYDRLLEQEQRAAKDRQRQAQDPAGKFREMWQKTAQELAPEYRADRVDLQTFKERLAGVVVAALEVEPNKRSMQRVLDVFTQHGSRATRDGVIDLLNEGAPVEKRLAWLAHRANLARAEVAA